MTAGFAHLNWVLDILSILYVTSKRGMMKTTYHFWELGRLPATQDNVAIATCRLEPGTKIALDDQLVTIDYTVLEGHRFAVKAIKPGEALLSWGLPFGIAEKPIAAGSYVCTQSMLETLAARNLQADLPETPNFRDELRSYTLDEMNFQATEQLPRYPEARYFEGFPRSPERGAGTRNVVLLLATSSLSASFVKELEAKLASELPKYPNIDGVVALAHTEGGTTSSPNNLELVLRTLAGFVVHPNIAAVLCVDVGTEAVTNERLENYMKAQGYPLEQVPHAFLSLNRGFAATLSHAETLVKSWLPEANSAKRQAVPVSHLKLALQCGGSDAFSGVSGNPLAAWVAREIIRYGGAANLAETDELIGAEAYILQKVKDLATAKKFLKMIERFKERVAWHGASAEGNPSGGNKLRGLYNIVLKSIGAAMKKDPELSLDAVIDYGEPMKTGGFYFMDSPGNDLESIAGQVASGCNLIFFVTGNGSITNFPFVPTIKIVTTSERFALLKDDMDVNAGAYLEGTSMEQLGQEMLELSLSVVSGEKTVGEKAQHAQVQLWRNWQQQDAAGLAQLLLKPLPDAKAIRIRHTNHAPQFTFEAFQTAKGLSSRQLALILPTSLCSGQISHMIATHLNRSGLAKEQGIAGFVALVHTEGCGVSSGESEALYVRTLLGYLQHPVVHSAFLLEHGCEKTHNDYMRQALGNMALDPESFGWASIQLDGGIAKVRENVESWFKQRLEPLKALPKLSAGFKDVRLGLMASGFVPETASQLLAQLTKLVVSAGGTVVIPEKSALLASECFQKELFFAPYQASLAYGQAYQKAGFHCMEQPTEHWVETLTGLGATGVELIVAYVGDHPQQSHPLLPVMQVTADAVLVKNFAEDIDLQLTDLPSLLTQLAEFLSGNQTPRLAKLGNVDFQISRGLLGVSL